jgi:cytochrome c oxidase subunit III
MCRLAARRSAQSMSNTRTLDVSELPDHGFGTRSVLWWATMGIITIELTVFVLTIASYFYLQGRESEWPPAGTPEPELFWATINTVLLVASLFPNQKAKTAAEKKELTKVRVWLSIASVFAVAFVTIRFIEFRHLRVSWDTNAYASITWALLGFHTFHVVTDLFDSLLLLALMFTHHGEEPKRMVDVSENGMYWYFVVLTWLPIYLVLYWSPRWL